MATDQTIDPATQESTDNLAPEQTEESTTSATSEDGQHEDADTATLKKQLSDKDSYITKLETENRQLKKPEKSKDSKVPSEDDTLWIVENASDLKMCKTEYQDYISKGYSKQDALRLAKLDKGLIKSEVKQSAEVQPIQGETRNSKTKTGIPASVKRLNPKMTEEQYARYTADMEAERKALRS